MRKFYLHIGLPKAASTFFQRDIFPALKAVHYLGQPRYDLLSQRAKYDRTTLSRFFDRSPAVWSEMGEAFAEKLVSSVTDNKKNSYLISDENAITGGIVDPYAIGAHLKTMASVFAQKGFSAFKLLIFIRRQDTWLASAYAQTSARYSHASQQEFEQRVERYLDAQADYYCGPGVKLDYELLHEHLADGIGNENILLLPFELLKTDAVSFVRKLLTFMDAEKDIDRVLSILNESPKRNVKSASARTWLISGAEPRREVEFEMHPGRVFSALGLPRSISFHFDGPERGTSITLTDYLTERILNRYSVSNRHLSDRLGLGLGQYGYY